MVVNANLIYFVVKKNIILMVVNANLIYFVVQKKTCASIHGQNNKTVIMTVF